MISVVDEAAMQDFGVRLASLLRAGDVVVLDGPLGAGKTTLTRGIGQGLSVRGAVTSPTFVIARVHPSLCGGPALVHVDAYRLGTSLEVEDLDLDESLALSVTVVEWGQGKIEGLAQERLIITIDRSTGTTGGQTRQVHWQGIGDRWAAEDLSVLAQGVPS